MTFFLKIEEMLKKLPTLEKANTRMGQLIDDLLELSRLDRTEEMQPELVNMNNLVSDVFKTHQFKIKQKGIRKKNIPDFFQPSITICTWYVMKKNH